MSDITTAWSIPWHELQKSLAAGIGIAALGCNAAADAGPLVKAAKEAPASWLVRAHTRANPKLSPQDNCRITDR